MKLPTRFIALFGGVLLLTCSFALAQDERRFQAYYKQAQGYENLKDYQKAIMAYRQAQSNATPEASKSIDKKIERLDELLKIQQFANGGSASKEDLISEAEKKINKLSSLSNRKRFRGELEKLQQRDDVTAANYQQLIRRIDVEGNNSEVAVPPPAIAPQRSIPAHHAASPPPKRITSSKPGITPKSMSDFRTTKSAGSLLNGSRKPHL